MQCEVCGHKIFGKSYKVIIEGAKLTVCGKCVKYGKIVWDERTPKRFMSKTKASTSPLHLFTKSRKPPQLPVESTLELVEDFDAKIRQARLKLKFSHEDLGRKINEKVSVLKKLETGKMAPDNKLATKLEHALKIKLLAPASEKKIQKAKISGPVSRELTFGDLVKLDKKKTGEKTQRKQS